MTSQLLAFVERTSDLVGVVDDESRIVYLNDAARKRLGVGDSSGLTTADMFGPEAFTQYYEQVRPALLRHETWSGELAVLNGAGSAVPMLVTVVADVGPGGEIKTLVAVGREFGDPTSAAPSPEEVYDDLTGLPGRAILDDRMRVALARGEREGRGVAVIVADVDALKDINDSFGHAVGDEVLRRIARTMTQVVRGGDTVARVGGDEFVVLLEGLEATDTAWEVTGRLRDAVCRAPIEPGEDPMAVTASFGLAVANAGDAPGELLQRADAAMYRAKAVGGAKVTMFEADAEMSITKLADELAVAVSHGLIRPHVQSVVDLETGKLVGYQGLARWQHPHHGLLDADQFVHVVASTPILPVIDLAVLRRTAAAAARATRNGARLNAYGHLSRRLLGDNEVERYLGEIIDDLGIAPSVLCVEIAHSLVARPSRTVGSALRTLRDIGVRIVLTGVDGECEVNEIVEYGFDELRLERRLVLDAGRDATRRRVAYGTIALARALGLTVIAVGIENETDLVDLREAGCNYGQGYFIGAVQPAGTVD